MANYVFFYILPFHGDFSSFSNGIMYFESTVDDAERFSNVSNSKGNTGGHKRQQIESC